MHHNDKGYIQSIESVAWNVSRLIIDMENDGISSEEMVQKFQMETDQEFNEPWDRLEDIIYVITKTYNVSPPNVIEDVLQELIHAMIVQ